MTNTAQLVYDAARELLSGTIGQEPPFSMKAYSGGSRGHRIRPSGNKVLDAKRAEEYPAKYLYDQANTAFSHLATTPEKHEDDKDPHSPYTQRGGTLPPGHYLCHYAFKPKLGGECIQLDKKRDSMGDSRYIFSPFWSTPIPHGRSGMFIHGPGPKGSDGCIVPTNDMERHRLVRAVKRFQGKVFLDVRNVAYLLPAALDYPIV